MANEQNQSSIPAEKNGLPTRMLRIEGERTARMYANAIRVSRIDERLRVLSLSTKSEQRKQHRLGDEGFSQAMAQFEDMLSIIEKDIANTNVSTQNTQRNRQKGQRSQAQARGVSPRNAERTNTGADQGAAANNASVQAKPQQQAQPAKPQQPAKVQNQQSVAPAEKPQQPQVKPQQQPQGKPQQQPAKAAQQKPQQPKSQQQPGNQSQPKKPGNSNPGQQQPKGGQKQGGQKNAQQAAQNAAPATPALT